MKPLRRFLLNEQIKLEARRIAHEHTRTCANKRKDSGPLPNLDDYHTKNCNALTREITALCMQIKLAGTQPPIDRREDGPAIFDTMEEEPGAEVPPAGDAVEVERAGAT